MNIKEEQIKAIKELILPYWKGEKERSVMIDENGSFHCKYNHPDGRHCAFAIACKPKERKRFRENYAAKLLLKEKGQSILKEKYQNLFDNDQWNVIQKLHDNMITIYKDMLHEDTITFLGSYSLQLNLGIDLSKILKKEEFGIDLE